MTRFKKFFTLDNPELWVLNHHIGNYNTNIQLTRNFSHSVYVKLCIVKYLIGLELWVLMILGIQSADLSVDSLLGRSNRHLLVWIAVQIFACWSLAL